MSLLNLPAPYHTLRMIVYTADFTAQIKKCRVQHIAGNLYKSREKDIGYDSFGCALYVYFQEIGIGFRHEYTSRAKDLNPEKLCATVSKMHLDSFEHFKDDIGTRIAERDFFTNAELLLLEIYAPELFPAAQRVKQELQAEREAERRQDKEQQYQKQLEDVRATNAAAADKVRNLVGRIHEGDVIGAEEIEFYRTIDKYSCINCFNLLADIYGVDIPINVRGWINKRLASVEIGPGIAGGIQSHSYYRGKSQTFTKYMDQVVSKIKCSDGDDSALEAWINSLHKAEILNEVD